jgi:hypothetical protein
MLAEREDQAGPIAGPPANPTALVVEPRNSQRQASQISLQSLGQGPARQLIADIGATIGFHEARTSDIASLRELVENGNRRLDQLETHVGQLRTQLTEVQETAQADRNRIIFLESELARHRDAPTSLERLRAAATTTSRLDRTEQQLQSLLAEFAEFKKSGQVELMEIQEKFRAMMDSTVAAVAGAIRSRDVPVRDQGEFAGGSRNSPEVLTKLDRQAEANGRARGSPMVEHGERMDDRGSVVAETEAGDRVHQNGLDENDDMDDFEDVADEEEDTVQDGQVDVVDSAKEPDEARSAGLPDSPRETVSEKKLFENEDGMPMAFFLVSGTDKNKVAQLIRVGSSERS